jgi:hypothetical protein
MKPCFSLPSKNKSLFKDCDPIKPKKKAQSYPRIYKNGKVYPVSARNSGLTVEDVLNTKIRRKKREKKLKEIGEIKIKKRGKGKKIDL